MTTILTFIIPALIVVLLSLPLVNVFKGKVTAKSAKMRLGTHICGFFGLCSTCIIPYICK